MFHSLWLRDCSTPSLPVHHQLPELAQTHIHRVSDAVQLSHPQLSPSPPAFNLSQHQGLFHWVSNAIQLSHPLLSPSSALNIYHHQGLFQWISSLLQVAKVLEFQLQHSPSNEYSGLICFRIDWFDLLVFQGTLKSLLQHHSSKASILWLSAFFTVQLSHPYMTTGKTTALHRWTFVGKVMSLLFNVLPRLVLAFFQETRIFEFHGCSHHLQWFWSTKK